MPALQGLIAAAVLGLGLARGAQDPQAPAEPPAPAQPALPSAEPVYRSPADVARWLDALVAAAPAVASPLDHAPLRDAKLAAIQLAGPGLLAPQLRPTLLLVGGLDGRSLSGVEAVLACVRALAERPATLGPDFCVVAIPCASPDALDRYLRDQRGDGGNGRAVDDDGDGRSDEDGPDDLTGDGIVSQMLIEDPAGPWTKSDDERFLVPAGPTDAPRYVLCPEGRDDDGDGRYNEDGPGGVVLDLNFPLGRNASDAASKAGPLPLSEAPALALADLARGRKLFAVVLFQGSHGGVAIPGGVAETERWASADASLYERCARDFAAATGRVLDGPASLRAARGENCGGAALDWFAGVPGALSLEFAAWGPQVAEGPREAARDAVSRRTAPPMRRPPSARDLAWRGWLDNVNESRAFLDWIPVDLGRPGTAFVGGWRPWTIENPPPADLPRALEGCAKFVGELAAAQPRLELKVTAERNGELVTLRARIKNAGALPTALAARSAVRPEAGAWIRLELGEGAKLHGGAERREFARLVGGDSTSETVWLVQAPRGARLAVAAGAPWCLDVREELAP